MQKMLVGLVLFLTVAVGGLGIVVLNLEPGSRGPSRSASRDVDNSGVDPAVFEALKKQISSLQAELQGLRKTNRLLAADVATAKRLAGAPRTARPADDDGDEPAEDERWTPPDDRALATGHPAVTEQDVEHFMAIQKEVETRRRIDGQTRNMVRRIERLIGKGEIQPVEGDKREKLDRIMRQFVTSQDTLITLYVRDPSPEVKALTAEERRDRRAVEGEQVIEQTRIKLEALVGADDANVIAEKTLNSLFGSRRNLPGRRGAGFRRNG